jgi:hypothetical protein
MKLINTNRFYLKGTNNQFLHIATVQDGLHEYMAFYDCINKKLYLESIDGGKLEYIEDDQLAKDLADFLFDKNITNLKYGDFTADN